VGLLLGPDHSREISGSDGSGYEEYYFLGSVVCGLFYYAVIISEYIASKYWAIMDNELESIWKKVIVA
jgi:hypothetical protein